MHFLLPFFKYYVPKTSTSGGLFPPDLLPGFAPVPHWGPQFPEPPDWPVFNLGLSGGIPTPSPQKIDIPRKFDETEEPEARIHGWMTLTKNLVPICTKFGQLILRKITKIVATRCRILGLKCT